MPLSFLKSRSMYPFLVGAVTAVFLIPMFRSLEHATLFAPYAPYLWIAVVATPVLVVLGYGVGVLLFGNKRVIREILRFAVIGVSNFAVDSGMLLLLVAKTGVSPEGDAHLFDPEHIKLLLLNAISVSIAICNSYVWNRWWTFGDRGETLQPTFVKFIGVSVGAIIINTAAVGLALQMFTIEGDDTSYMLIGIKMIATIVSMSWNFVGYKFFVFLR